MDDNFMLKEKEFLKQNQELELKRKALLEQVEDTMKMQQFIFKQEDNGLRKPFFSHLPDNIDTAKDLKLPKSVDEMSTKGMLQFYKAKIKALQSDIQKLQTELKQKADEINKTNKSYENTSEEKEKWFLQYNIEKNNSLKLEKQVNSVTSKLQLKENEIAGLKKENEKLKNEIKNTTSDLNASENRLQRALQEIEKTKAQLKTVRQDEKETKEAYKTNIKDLTATVKQIQKHKTELINGYKKQLQLIEILKKQKVHVENAKMLDIAEVDFMKLLDWKLE